MLPVSRTVRFMSSAQIQDLHAEITKDTIANARVLCTVASNTGLPLCLRGVIVPTLGLLAGFHAVLTSD